MITAVGLPAALTVIPTVDNPSADFSDTPLWLSLVKALLIFVYLLVSTLLVIWFERRVIGRMQQRPGPNRNGPFGLLQTLADGMKSMFKEDVTPAAADRIVFTLAPLVAATMCFVSFSIIPLGGQVWMFGHHTPLQLADGPVAVLLVLAVASVGAYGVIMAGWGSGSTYPLLGGLRSTAQIISYEIAMGLSLVAVFIYSGSMSTSQIVDGQRSIWNLGPAIFSFIVYVITMVGETNRLPFDLAEGEGELTGGFHTEYGSMRFAMFFLGEYINMFSVAALATTMFLGGWQLSMPAFDIGGFHFGGFAWDGGWMGLLWFTIKLWAFMFLFVWLRGSLPRVRYDQFMRFGWRFLIPATILWVVAVAFLRGSQNGWLGDARFGSGSLYTSTVVVIGVIFVLVLAAAWLWDTRSERVERRNLADRRAPEVVDPFAGGFPVPPLPGQQLREPVTVGATPIAPSTAQIEGTPATSSTPTTQEDGRA